jgi:hypothetical protein
MGDYTPKLQKAASPVLEPGEVLEAGVRAMSGGATARIVGGAAGSVVGGAAGALAASAIVSASSSPGEAATAAAGLGALPPQVAVGLTDRRLLIFKRGGISGAAKGLVATIDRAGIAAVDGEDSGSKLMPDRLTVTLIDGRAVDFEVVKLDGFQRVVDAFARQQGPRR